MGAAKGVIKLLLAPGSYVGTNYNDTITGSAGGDTLGGGNGDDIIHGGGGNDILWGDSFSSSDANDNGQDMVYGDAGNDKVHGGNGKDLVDGGADNDFVYGDNGTDDVRGGEGSDFLFGGNGDDVLLGGLGVGGANGIQDVLTGDLGSDRFVFQTLSSDIVTDSKYTLGAPGTIAGTGEAATWSKNWDVITDFAHLYDKIDLSQLVTTAGHALVWRAPFGSDADAGSNFAPLAYGVWTNSGGNFLYADIDGDGQADMKVQVTGVGEGDFVGVTYDHDAPVATMTITDDDPTVDSDNDLCDDDLTALVTIVFDEYVLNFDLADLSATHGTMSGLVSSDGGKSWTLTYTADQDYDGLGGVSILAGGYTDYSANLGVAFGPVTTAIDTKNPTVAITIADGGDGVDLAENADGTLVTFTFSEAVTGFTDSDVAVTGGTLGTLTQSLIDPLVWTAVFTADADEAGTATIDIATNGYEDDCGNDGVAGTLSFAYDTTVIASPPAVVDHIAFIADPTAAPDQDGWDGLLGHFVAYDASDNVIANAFTAADYGTGDKFHLAVDGTLTVDHTNNDNFFIQLFDQYVHFQVGAGGANTLDPDTLPGGASGDAIEIALGYGNDDTLTGDGLGDSLFGGNADDTLHGASGNDYLWGGDGNDALTGGAGADVLSGSAGDDTFTYTNASDSASPDFDLITDFSDGDDTISLTGIDANSGSGGNQNFASLTESTTVTANAANWYLDGTGNTVLQGDTTGDGVADFTIVLLGAHALNTTNVLL